MIIDAHCHAWETWPYKPAVPDPTTRGSIEQLIFEMNQHGVDRALIVCAEIEHNPANNSYVHQKALTYGDRLAYVVDVDSLWKSTYHTDGASERLLEAINQWHPIGFTHYINYNADDGAWLYSDEGLEFFKVAQDHKLIASIHCRPQHQVHIRAMAQHFPDLVILLHHMGHPKSLEPDTLLEILKTADHDNVFVKISGFYNATTMPQWDYPLVDVQPIVHALYQQYGGHRLLWGSDYPVCRRFYSYRHSIEILRRHCRFIPSNDMDRIMGDNLNNLLNR